MYNVTTAVTTVTHSDCINNLKQAGRRLHIFSHLIDKINSELGDWSSRTNKNLTFPPVCLLCVLRRWTYVWKALFLSLQDPVWFLPQHRLVHAHPCYGHVQRDPYLRHDKWHLLQVWHHSVIFTMETCIHYYTHIHKNIPSETLLSKAWLLPFSSLYKHMAPPVLTLGSLLKLSYSFMW